MGGLTGASRWSEEGTETGGLGRNARLEPTECSEFAVPLEAEDEAETCLVCGVKAGSDGVSTGRSNGNDCVLLSSTLDVTLLDSRLWRGIACSE